MDKAQIIKHLEERKEQLNALIIHLEHRGKNHPQYNQLENCKSELDLVISQLKRLK